jgi:DNA-binding MarR family transcriptional regulator
MTIELDVFHMDESLGFIIHHLDLRLKLGLHKAFKAKGINITAEQWGILNCLWEEEGIHQSAIAERIAKDRHSITRMLNRLESNGFVMRVPADGDKRRLNVHLTDSGRGLKEILIPIVLVFLKKAFAGLTPKEISEVIRTLNHIAKNLESLKCETH